MGRQLSARARTPRTRPNCISALSLLPPHLPPAGGGALRCGRSALRGRRAFRVQHALSAFPGRAIDWRAFGVRRDFSPLHRHAGQDLSFLRRFNRMPHHWRFFQRSFLFSFHYHVFDALLLHDGIVSFLVSSFSGRYHLFAWYSLISSFCTFPPRISSFGGGIKLLMACILLFQHVLYHRVGSWR